ncbi:LPS assembly lipoprotein LptE [Thermaurantiacus sp.]
MRRLPPLLLLLVASACSLQPIYSGGQRSAPATLLGAIEVAPIPERTGFLLRDALVARLGPPAAGGPRYRLEVAIDDRIEGFGVRGDNSIVRERRTLRARYRLTRLETGEILLESVAGADAGLDVVGSEYAVIAAEVTAAERLAEAVATQIIGRIATLAATPG